MAGRRSGQRPESISKKGSGLPALGHALAPYVVVFVASACTLILEIVAARILAPTIGVSVYTWTSIIGVVLAGISVGNYLGGRLADRFPSSTTLGLVLLAGGVSSLSILALVDGASSLFAPLPIVPRIVVLTAALFLAPSLILGMVTPIVIKLKLRDLAHTGDIVGKIYAVSTAGAILGTFATGFVLIQYVGSRQTVLVVALTLFVLAAVFGRPWRANALTLLLGVLFLALTGFTVIGKGLDSGCLEESNYYCISIRDTTTDQGQPVKALFIDKLLHSYVSVEDPTLLVYDYQHVVADLATHLAGQSPQPRALFVGGGGYTMPRYLDAVQPQTTVEVIEIDPKVTSVVSEHFWLNKETLIVTYNEDARMVVPRLAPGQYDLIVGDAFHDVSIPFHLTTREFNEDIAALLKAHGIYVVNVIDRLHSGGFLRAFVTTLQVTFPYVYILRSEASWQADTQETYEVMASFEPLSRETLHIANEEAGVAATTARFMPQSTFDAWLEARPGILLTDDHAPVENLMASIYIAEIDLSEAERHYNAGLELQAAGRPREAIDEYSKAIAVDSSLTFAFLNRGKLHSQVGSFDLAIKDLDEAVRLNPESALLLTARGTAYAVQGRFDQALADLNKALGFDPLHVDAYINRGTAYAVMGNYELALADLKEAIRLEPADAQTHAGRAVVHTALGDDEAAQQDFQQAVELGYNAAALAAEIEGVRRGR